MFTKNLENLRRERKISKTAFCKQLGVARSTFDDYLNGTTQMPADKIEKSAVILGVTVGYLFGEVQTDNEKQLLEMLVNQQKQLTEISELLKQLVR